MSGIEKIVKSVNSLLDKARTPVIPIPAVLLMSSVFKRPGMSPMIIASNVIKRQSEFGGPTGVLPDGANNMMNSLIYILSDEIIKEIRNNCVVESVIPPGTISIKGFGANAGGPVVTEGVNLSAIKVTGIPR